MSFAAQPRRTSAATKSPGNKTRDEIRRMIERYDIMRIMKNIKYKEHDLEHWLRSELNMEYPYDKIPILKNIYEERIRFHQDYHTIKSELISELIDTAQSHLKTRRTHTCVDKFPFSRKIIRSENNLPTVVRFYNRSYIN